MKKKIFAAVLSSALLLTACSASGGSSSSGQREGTQTPILADHDITLSDSGITLDGQMLAQDGGKTVTLSHDIVYYHDNTGEDYGAGTQADMHTREEADVHTVVTIREPGTYRVSGALSAGQLAVDLGEEAKRDRSAVVTLVLDGVDITCTVAPAVIFYNVYECDEAWVAYDEGEAEDYNLLPADVDTSAAGANVVLADGSVNRVNGSYVARIYKEGTTKKLHKYDEAFYSKMSLNISGETKGTGSLSITAENEGLDTELHLTINGGQIRIQAQNDGINTNEDGVSVTTVNGGGLQINAGLGEEGDGIDSNGHIVINGGTVYSMASDHSPDGGLDADGEILIKGGQVTALGVRNDTVSPDSEQLYMELSFASALSAGAKVELEGTSLSFTLEKGAQSILYSAPELERDVSYTLKVDGVVQQYTGHTGGSFGRPGEGLQPPEGQGFPEDGFRPPERQGTSQHPEEGGEPPQMPDGQQSPEPPRGKDRPRPSQGGFGQFTVGEEGEPSADFTLTDSVHSFSGIREQNKYALAGTAKGFG